MSAAVDVLPSWAETIAAIAPRIDPLIRRLATDHDGERLATVAAIERVLASGGLGFHDLAGVVADGVAYAELFKGDTGKILYCLSRSPLLSDWEQRFCRSLLDFRRLSPKQIDVLDRLVIKVQGGDR